MSPIRIPQEAAPIENSSSNTSIMELDEDEDSALQAECISSSSSTSSNHSFNMNHKYATPTLRRSDSTSSVSYIDMSKLLFASDFDFGLNIDTMSDSALKKLNSMKRKTQQTLTKYNKTPKNLELELDKIQEIFNQRLVKFDERIHRNLQSSSTEKLFYAVSIFIIAAAGFVIGKYPIYFPHFHTAIFLVLMPIRFYTYFKQSFQYYLADLCYYVNMLLMIFIWVFPNSPRLFVSVFSLSLGTLSFAVITWRNSLVLHSIDKTTSSFIHIMPPVTMFVMVHELPEEYVIQRYPGIAAIDNWNFLSAIIITSIYYTIWQVSYHYFISIRKKDKIEQGKVTSFSYLRKKNQKTLLGKFVNGLPYLWMQTLAFTLIQFGYQLLTMMFCPIWFKYKHACGAFVTFIFIWAAYNGATYYIDIFGKRLEKEVEKLKREIVSLQQENEKLQFSPVTRPQVPEEEVKPLIDEIH
ncbi:putative membrane protein [Spathaspora sp. JA1]|nr:putative membrane protein [Spathaspora sp. JA1]